MSDDGPNYLPAEHTRQSFEDGKRRYPKIMTALADDDPLPYLIAANERLHIEVQRLTDEHARMVEHLSGMDERTKWLNRRVYEIAAENLALRADLATSEQTIAALKAQLKRVKEAAE